MDDLLKVIQIIAAVSLPFIMLILGMINASVSRLFHKLDEHIKADAELAVKIAEVATRQKFENGGE